MKPGVRVVRGPDWMAKIRDPKSVDLGTLSYVPKNAADNKVQVVWDTGQKRSYKSGYNGEYELRAFDLQQVGIQHKGKKCSECSMNPLRGMRFHCPKCSTDICVMCYMTDKHATDHPFVRFDTPQSDKVNLPPRKLSKSLKLMGVFVNTSVIRGPHWSQTSTDGEVGTGKVKAFVEERDGLGNAYVQVMWEIGKVIKEYRFGTGGFVDVIAAKCACGGKCYVEHLPVIGIIKLKNGDKVSVHMSLTEFKDAQNKAKVPEGWKEEMKQCLNEIGTVVDLLFDGSMANVQYPNGNMHIVCKAALNRKSSFCTGNAAKMINDKKMLQKLQEGHGGYSSKMENVLGKVGRILEVRPDGDVKMLFDKKRFTFNPTCLTLVEDQEEAKKAPDFPPSDVEDEEEEEPYVPERDSVPGKKLCRLLSKEGKDKENIKAFSNGFLTMMSILKTNQDLSSLSCAMYDAFGLGKIDEVIAIVTRHRDLMEKETDGKTILHLACHEGYSKLVSKLIELGANLSDKDDEGDTPLHYAAFGKQSDCVQMLLQSSADPNVKNNMGLTPLMIAVNHPDIDSVQYLVFHNADVSIQNFDMETAMHDAVSQKDKQPMIVQIVLGSKSADFTVCNSECFNVLQYAVYKNNLAAVKIILEKCQNLVDVPMSNEGFTALHIAAANDYIEIASSLIIEGKANPNAPEKEKRTPLHLAVAQEHKRVVVFLLDKGADPNAQDDNGDTPLHLLLIPLKKMELTKSMRSKGPDINVAIVFTLLERDADLHIKNKAGKVPVDMTTDQMMKGLINSTANYKNSPTKTKTGVTLPMQWDSFKVTEIEIVTLDTGDTIQQQEYAEVEKQFRQTMEYAVIGSIKRVQNPLLWEHYTLKKREMERKHGPGMANEKHLYHGTKPELVQTIAYDNFDFRIAGTNVGAVYGHGAYFASTAKYSDLYASVDPTTGYKSMFIAKVLVGKTCIGSPGLKRPPEIVKNDLKQGFYDSTVNNDLNPAVFCVFDKNQYYPEYIVEYKCC